MLRWHYLAPLLLAVTACRREPVNARIDAAIAPLLAHDSIALAGLRIDLAQNTAFLSDVMAQGRIPALSEFQTITGLDPATQVWEVVWCLRPASTLVYIRGKFGGEFGLEPRLDGPGTVRQNYKGYYVVARGARGVLFMHSGLAVEGALADLHDVVDSRDKPGRQPPQALIDRVTALPVCHLWAVGRAGTPWAEGIALLAGHDDTARMIRLLESISSGPEWRRPD